ncbi:MAG: histidine kinase dimerization/phospho-acceptor domain-containing protein, partial [Gammaproteobacteria bacterium]
MRPAPARGAELTLIVVLVLAGLLAGLALGRAAEGLAAGAIAALLLLAWRFRRLAAWALAPAEQPGQPPSAGLAGAIAAATGRRLRELSARADAAGESAERWQRALSVIDEAIVILDADQAIGWFNPAATRLLGLRHPEDIGRRIGNLLRFPGLSEFIDSPGDAGSFEATVPGAAALSLQFGAQAFGSGETLLLARDVSELRRLETVRQDFVANISHNLRTPLTVIAGYVDTLEDLLPGGSPVIVKVLSQMR